MTETMTFKSTIRKQQTNLPKKYGRIVSEQMGAWVGKKVKVTLEEIE
jgi:hypothetical protein